MVKRKTQANRLVRKLKAIREDMRHRMHAPVREQHRWVCQVLRGHYRYSSASRGCPTSCQRHRKETASFDFPNHLLCVGDREARADCQCGELIDRIAASLSVRELLFVEALGHMRMPFAGSRPDHRAGVELATIDAHRAAEAAADLERRLDDGASRPIPHGAFSGSAAL
jgi:hypothetical protein